jgi:hypothetical protein
MQAVRRRAKVFASFFKKKRFLLAVGSLEGGSVLLFVNLTPPPAGLTV